MKNCFHHALVFMGLTALISSCAIDPTAQAFPELDAEIKKHVKAGHSLGYPVVKKSVKPVYPSMMASGNVWSVMKVGPTGNVEEVRILGKAPAPYQESILKALKQWQFQPGTVNGRPATFPMQMKIAFAPHAGYAAKADQTDDGITFEPGADITKTLYPQEYGKLAAFYREGRKVTKPKFLHRTLPKYPQGTPASGFVWVAFIIDEFGRPRNVQIIGDRPKEFTDSILTAVSTWQFEAATVDGRKEAFPGVIKMVFKLRQCL
jgi:TonB family protein